MTGARVGLAVLLLAAAARLAGLGTAPFWMDEASTAAFASLPWADLVGGIGRLEPNPPLYYGLMKLWTGLTGTSDLAFRLPSVLVGVAGVAALMRLASVSFGAPAAVWTGLLAAVQPHLVDHGREARGYALLLLAVALAAIAARRVAVGGGWAAALALAGCAGVAIWLHNTGVLAVACVFVFGGVTALAAPGPHLPRFVWLLAAGLGALGLGAPALFAAWALAAGGGNNAGWIPVPSWDIATQVVLSVLATPLSGLRGQAPGLVLSAFAAAALLVALVVLWATRAAARGNAAACGLLAGLITSVSLMVAISQVVPVLIERTLLFALVFYLPLLGALLASQGLVLRMALLSVVLALAAPSWPKVWGPLRHNEDWRGLAAGLSRAVAETGWPVLVLGGFEAVAIDRYLPAEHPARPALSITPDIGASLTEAVTARWTRARALPQGIGPAAFCAAAGRPSGVLLVVRQSAILPSLLPGVEAMLGSAGGRTGAAERHGSLAIVRWPGVCG